MTSGGFRHRAPLPNGANGEQAPLPNGVFWVGRPQPLVATCRIGSDGQSRAVTKRSKRRAGAVTKRRFRRQEAPAADGNLPNWQAPPAATAPNLAWILPLISIYNSACTAQCRL